MTDGFTLGSEGVSFHYEQTIIRTFIIENFYLTVVDQQINIRGIQPEERPTKNIAG